MIESPSDRVPEKAPIWDLTRTEACGGEEVFLVCPLVYEEYLGIYRSGTRVRRALHGAHKLAGRPQGAHTVSLWPTHGSPGLLPKLHGCLLVQEKSSKSFVPFGIDFL